MDYLLYGGIALFIFGLSLVVLAFLKGATITVINSPRPPCKSCKCSGEKSCGKQPSTDMGCKLDDSGQCYCCLVRHVRLGQNMEPICRELDEQLKRGE
jgi:hypothetical protein